MAARYPLVLNGTTIQELQSGDTLQGDLGTPASGNLSNCTADGTNSVGYRNVPAAGDIVSIFNNTTGNITITCSITTAYIAGTNTDKDTMTLATRGVATILFISGTVCVVTGNVS